MFSKRVFGVVSVAVAALPLMAAGERFSYEESAIIAEGIVFGTGAELDVAEGVTATAIGTLSIGENASGDITKTGGGTFELATAIPDGAANGDGAEGGKAKLTVNAGTFAFNADDGAASVFSGGVTLGGTGALSVKGGATRTAAAALGGRPVTVTGGTFLSQTMTGAASVNISGGTFGSTNTFTATSSADGASRIDVAEGGTLTLRGYTATAGSDASIHMDGGTIRPIQFGGTADYSGRKWQNGTVYVGGKGMTFDISDTVNWGIWWELPVRSEPGVEDGGIDMVSSESKTTRLYTNDIQIDGGIRVGTNVQLMLCADGEYATDFTLIGGTLRAVGKVTLDRLVCTAENQTLRIGVKDTENTMGCYTLKEFTPPTGRLTIDWMRGDTTSNPTIANLSDTSYDVLKFPASVDFSAKRVFFNPNSATVDYRITEREENGWRIISVTIEPAGTTGGVDPRESSDWQTGTGEWEIGPWLYSYQGATMTTAAPLLLTPAKAQSAGISVPDGVTLTLAGGIYERHGGFAKLGGGNLALTGDKAYQFGRDFTAGKITAAGPNAMFDATGANVRNTYGELTVGAGTLTIGNGSDSPYVAVRAEELNIGTATTDDAGAERDAALVLNSGTLHAADWTIIGRMHGNSNTCERLPIRSTFTQNGGTALLDGGLILAHDGLHVTTMDVRFILNGGDCTVGTTSYIGSTGGGGGNNTALLQVNGGTLTFKKALTLQRYNDSDTLSATFELNGGTVRLDAGMTVGYATGTKTVNLNGGVLCTRAKLDGGNKAGTTLNWGGTVVKPTGDTYFSPLMTGFATVNVPGEAVIDLSDYTTHYTDAANNYASIDIGQSFTGPGPIVVRGAATNHMLRFTNGYTMPTGGVVVEKGGVVLNLGALRTAKVLVKDGGAVSAYSTVASRYEDLQLGETDSDATAIYGYNYPSDSALPLIATNSLSVHGKVYVGYIDPNYGTVTLPANAAEVLCAPKGSLAEIGLGTFELHPSLAAKGCVATFSIDETDPTCDRLRIAVTYGTENATWTAAGSGEWGEAANWSVAPAAEAASVVFPSTLAGDITVSSSSAVNLRSIAQDSAHTVTIPGDVAFARSPNTSMQQIRYDVSNPSGVLELAGKVSSVSPLIADARTSGAGTLRVTGGISGAPEITITSGRIEGAPEALGSAKLNLSNASVRFTDSGVFKGQLLHADDDTTGLGVDVADGKTVYVTGLLNNKTAFTKLGGGKVVFAYGGANSFTGKRAKNAKETYAPTTNGDVPNSTGFTVYSGTVEFNGGDAATYGSGAIESWVGFHPVTDATGTGAYDARLVVRSGKMTVGSYLAIGRTVAAATDGPVQLGYTRRPRALVDIYGTLTAKSVILSYGNYKNANCYHAELNVHPGGTLIITANGDDGRFAICHEGTNSRLDEGGNEAVVNLYEGGLIDKRGDQDVRVGFHNGSKSATYPARGIINIHGGTFRTLATAGVDLSCYNAHGTLNLYGGTLETGCIKRSHADTYYSAQADVHFDGGTFKPLQSEKSIGGLTTFTVGAGGAKFDLGETNTLTLAQTLSTADGVEKDGGITLTATSTDAILALTADNAFNGPLTVNGGVMRPGTAAAASCAEGVAVNAGGVFDANGFALTFGYLKGDGGTYTNGTVTVTGTVEPGGLGLRVQNLVFGSGATLKCAAHGDAETGWAAPCLKVSGSVTAQGGVTLDLGGTEDSPLPKGLRVKVAEVAAGGVFPALRGVGALARNTTVSVSRCVNGEGATEAWAEVVPLGTVLSLR